MRSLCNVAGDCSPQEISASLIEVCNRAVTSHGIIQWRLMVTWQEGTACTASFLDVRDLDVWHTHRSVRAVGKPPSKRIKQGSHQPPAQNGAEVCLGSVPAPGWSVHLAGSNAAHS